MQKPLNTSLKIMHSPTWHRLFSSSKRGLLSSLVLLLLGGLISPAKASDFYKDFVIINGTYYNAKIPSGLNTGLSNFDGYYYGEFDRGNGRLTLGAEANTFSTDNEDVQPPQLFYRVYLEGTQPPSNFTPLNLGFAAAGIDGANNKKWENTSTNLNLVATTNTPGVYVLEVFFRSEKNYNSGIYFYDSRNGPNYKGYFKVNGTLPIWNGNANNDWFNADNWEPKTVPTSNTDAIIPLNKSGNIPVISGGTASVRTLTVNGDPSTPVISLLQSGGNLKVYGNFNNNNGAFRQTNGTFIMAGSSTQAFDGASFVNFKVEGGSDKYLRGRMDVATALTFQSGRISTLTDDPTQFGVDLGAIATVYDESETSYVLGVLRSKDQLVVQDQVNSFGNIGIDLLATSGSPGSTLVTRITGPNDFAYSGVGTSKSIRRGFIFEPRNRNPLSFKLIFHYLNTELGDTPENNLTLFRSLTGSNPFEKLVTESVDLNNNILTSGSITGTLSATFTLGNSANPLPVTLISFTATPTAQGAALLRWITATETNNKGFGIERQLANGDAWQSIGYLASGNNATGGTYEYTDKSLASASYTPQAYYRLRQEDQDGKLSYSPVAVVSRPAEVASASLQLSPVPVKDGNLSLTFAEANQAGTEISIINTQGQRLFSQTTQASSNATLCLPVESLAAGIYIVSVRVPGQAVRHARFIKL